MKILLDENLPKQLKADFGFDYEVKTVRDMGWLGKKNGELLGLIVFNGFDFFVTINKNLRFQQNLDRIELKIFLLLAVNNRSCYIMTTLRWQERTMICASGCYSF